MTESEFDLSREITNNLYNEFSWLFQNNLQYVKMVNIVDNAIDNYAQPIRADERKKVVEEIRKFIQEKRTIIKNDFSSYATGKDSGLFQINDFLDQVEKGESNERNS